MYRICGEDGCAGRVLYRICGEGGCAGRVLYRKCAVQLVLGEFCTQGARRGCCWANNVLLWRSARASCWAIAAPWHRSWAVRPSPPCPWRSPRRRWGFCTTRSPLTECRRRVEPSCSAIPPDWWRRGRPKTADVQQRPARARAGHHDIQQSGVLQCSLRGEHEDHHDCVVERVEQPRVGDVLPGLHVHERQNDAERQVGEEVLPLMAVHVGEQCR